jgi:tRNA A-37 threonylcarbamoyl transferase component Bud32
MLPNCVILETPAATLWCDPLVPMPARKSIARDPQRFIRSAASMPVKISRETLVLQTELPLDGQTVGAVVKHYRPRTIWKAAAAMFRQPKAVQNWAKAEFLVSREIATPQPLLACRMRGWKSIGNSFLVTRWIAGENMHLFGWRLAKLPSNERLRLASACAKSLGRLVGRMHASGAVHRDLKMANLLVVENQTGLETWLVDLDGLQIGMSLSPARRARDIARLAAGLAAHRGITRSICLRFLRAYTGAFPGYAIDWKSLWRIIAARAEEIIRRKHSRGEEVL